jgi:hypothetical protein
MRRDMDLVREILRQIEAWPEAQGLIDFDLPDRSPEEVIYHVEIMAKAGLIEAQDASTLARNYWRAKKLTWKGHEFLEAARNDTIWKKAKTQLTEKVGGMSFDVMLALLKEIAKRQVLGED